MVAVFALKSALRLWIDSFSQYTQFYQDNSCEEFPNDVEERDAAIIVTVAPVTLVLVESDYVGIPHDLQNSAFSLALTKYLM